MENLPRAVEIRGKLLDFLDDIENRGMDSVNGFGVIVKR